MIWLTTVVVVLVMGAIAVVAAGRGTPMLEEYDDRPDVSVPGGDLRGRDLRQVRFSLGFRGYRMSEVDALLDRVADQLDATGATGAWQPPEARPETDLERPRDDSGLE